MLQFCDEVCVVDGGSTDGTFHVLSTYAEEEPRLKVKQIVRNWNDPRFAIFDGMQKAEARKMCTLEFCWQMDSDEIVHEDDVTKILDLARAMPKDTLLLALPVIEYWGGPDKVRIDVTPWKWRLSRNDPNITHGVPGQLRVNRPIDDSIVPYVATQGTDGCDMIFADSLEPVPFITFYDNQVDNIRRIALASGDVTALKQYSEWFNAVVSNLPCVFHYSWYDLARKIKLYRGYWTKHWNSLYGGELNDSADNNMMFDVPWSKVTDEMIDELASTLQTIGGWIWHRKWDRKVTTPHMQIQRTQPKIMLK
jgi:glycosyltransferase involved in cell wall biosynthesis